MAISQEDALSELRKRFSTLKPRQQAAVQELERRGVFGDVDPVAPKPIETVLPSGVSEEDFARIQRTGLTPGTAVQHAGVSIATENNRRQEAGIPGLSAKQQEARLRLFQQQAGTPGSEIVDQFQVFQERERNERGTTLGGRIRSAGLGLTTNIGGTGTSIIGLFAPETANNLSEELRAVLNPDGSRAGKAGALLGELSKVASFATTGPVGLAAIFGAQGAGSVRQEVETARSQGQEISGAQEFRTAALVGGTEAVSGLVAGKIFGRLGQSLKSISPITRIGLQQGKVAAVSKLVKSTLPVLGNLSAEGAEEGLTQLITNKIRQGIKPELALTEGVLEAAATGLLLAPFGAAGSPTSQAGQTTSTGDAVATPSTGQLDLSPESQNVDTSVVSQETPVGDTQTAQPSIDDTQTTAKVEQGQEVKRTPEGGIQTSKAGVAEVRSRIGLPELKGDQAQEFQTELDNAVKEDLPNQALQIAQEVNRNPAALTIKKTAALGVRAVQLQEVHASLNESLQGADPARVKALSNEMLRMEQELDQITTAINTSRSEAGRALVAGKIKLDRDISLASTIVRAKSAKDGKPLTLTERAKLTGQVKKLKEINKKLKAAQKKQGVIGEGQSASKFLSSLGLGATEVQTLQFQQNQAVASLNRSINSMKPRSIVETISEPLNLVRSILTSADVSAVLRQGGKIGLANPVRAGKALGPMFRALASEKQAFLIDQDIQKRADSTGAREAGLDISALGSDSELNQQEEVFMSRLSKLIPGIRASERAFVTFLNKLRVDSFDAMSATLAKNGAPTAGEARVIANFVNIATGRGKLNQKIEPAANALATVFFAPRYVASQFQFATLQPLRQREITGRVAAQITKEYAKMLIGWSVVAGLFAMAGFKMGTEPTSSDFLKFRKGDTRVDLGTGLIQPIVLQQRIQQGKTTSPVSGKTRSIRGPRKTFAGDDVFDVLARFGRTKLAPIPGLSLDIMVGENVIGQKVDVKTVDGIKQVAANNLVPISMQEIFETMTAPDLAVPEATALSILALFGAGVSTFGRRTQRKKERR
jgi:hypothetical protein